MKVRRKATVIDAVQFDGANLEAIKEALELPDDGIRRLELNTRDHHLTVLTNHGAETALPSSWIMKGPGDALNVCADDIFVTTYESVEVEAEREPDQPPTRRRGW